MVVLPSDAMSGRAHTGSPLLPSPPIKVVGKTRADIVFETIDEAILNGDIAPGSKLTEEQLATHFGISRGPLREAINRLEGRGLIERVPHAGVRVVALSETDLGEIYAMREVLEGLACRLATLNMTDGEIDGLKALVKRQHLAGDQLPPASVGIGHGWDLHWRIVHGTGNPRLTRTICNELYYRLRIYRNRQRSEATRVPRAVEEHVAIVDAIARRKPDQAEMLMRWHVRAAYDHLRADLSLERPVETIVGKNQATD
jgi:DNA-binding GntR family transcriptional regulator